MGRRLMLGQEGGAAISISPDGRTLTWFVPNSLPDPVRLWVSRDGEPRKPQTEGRGGVETIPWVVPGSLYRWDMTAGENNVLVAALMADTRNGFPLHDWIPADVPSPAAVSALAPSGGSSAGPLGPASSWFDQEMIGGVPNLYLAVGAGLLGVAIISKKKG